MRSMEHLLSRQTIRQDTRSFSSGLEVGLVLMDMSLRPIAIDRGASSILNGRTTSGVMKPRSAHPFLPKEIVDMIGSRDAQDLSSQKLTIHVGTNDYSCRAYFMEANNGFPAMIALHIEKISMHTDPVSALAAKYNLTEREEETLRGISMGLSSKELASRMTISPNTVKVFLRLIMIKMGVSSRGALISQILQHQTSTENHDALAARA